MYISWIITLLWLCSTFIKIISTSDPLLIPDIQNKEKSSQFSFSRNMTGVLFYPYVLPSYISTTDTGQLDEQILTELLTTVHTKFDHILVEHDTRNIHGILETIAKLNKLKPNSIWQTNSQMKMSVRCEFTAAEITSKQFLNTAENLAEIFNNVETVSPGAVKYIIFGLKDFPLFQEKEQEAYLKFRQTLCNFSKTEKYFNCSGNDGLEISWDSCEKSSKRWGVISRFIYENKVDNIWFSLEPSDTTSKTSLVEYLNFVTNVVAKCKEKTVLNPKFNNSLNFGVISLYPDTDDDKTVSYSNFLKHWSVLNRLAGRLNITVLFLQAFDNPYADGTYWQTNGFWKVVPVDGNKISYKIQSKEFLSDPKTTAKREEALKSSVPILEISLGIGIGMLVICFVGAGGLFWFWKRNKMNILPENYLKSFFKGDNNKNDSGSSSYLALPYDRTSFEIAKSQFSINYGKALGQGEFGKSCVAVIKRKNGEEFEVAVKMLKKPYSPFALQGLLSEIKVLAYLGSHENVVKLIGASTEDIKKGNVYVFLEYCKLGSLESYLKTIREEDAHFLETVKDLLRWSTEIVSGLEYISSKNVVHGDIAARNILLNSDKIVKICDFGLSRRLENYQTYVKTGQEPLPWCWMSPESLQKMEFNEKTDVWSFGVTIWEIYSLGDRPYQGLSWDVNFARMLETGLRLGKPRINQKEIYEIMLRCWSLQPEVRPTFSELKAMLLQITPKIIVVNQDEGNAIGYYININDINCDNDIQTVGEYLTINDIS